MSGDKIASNIRIPFRVIRKSPSSTIFSNKLLKNSLVLSIKSKTCFPKAMYEVTHTIPIMIACSSGLIPELEL
jgi:hypothetical protein